jgi:hypothetical protein
MKLGSLLGNKLPAEEEKIEEIKDIDSETGS